MTTITTEQRVPHQIPRAHDALDEKVTHTTAERDALRQFHARCVQVDPTTPSSPSHDTPRSTGLEGVIQSMTAGGRPSSGGPLTQLQEAYHETVMAAEVGDELNDTYRDWEEASHAKLFELTDHIRTNR